MKYRKEIDGLRALAVLPVILFHAGFTTFSGGFVGVDIFFVISGYLITTIIVDEMDKGSFSLLNFYERRARRILPALFFVMLCTLPYAWFWMLPQDLKSFSQSLVAVPLFASNVLFYLKSGYFDTASELKPLLHTWSLAVEEQYYVLFPVFLMLAWKLGKKRIISLLALVALVSVIAAQWGSATYPSFSFYLLPTRAFEILIGALISLYINHKQSIISVSQSVSQSVSLAGFALILYAIFAFDKNTPSPSLYTLIPTIGAGLILVFANNGNIVGKLLGSKLVVGIGLISYSVYLWHQPLLAFARLRSINEASPLLLGLLASLSILLGFLSWKYIEAPFRNKNLISRKNIIFYSALTSLFFISLGLIGHITKGYEQRLPKSVIAQSGILKAHETLRDDGGCNLYKEDYIPAGCIKGDKNTSPNFALVGDSHASALAHELSIAFSKSNISYIQYTKNGCPFAPYTHKKKTENCDKYQAEYLKDFDSKGIDTFIIASRWAFYINDDDFDNTEGGVEKHGLENYYSANSTPIDAPYKTRKQSILKSYQDAVISLLDKGKTVILIYPVPEQGWDIPAKKAKQLLFNESSNLSIKSEVASKRNSEIISIFNEIGNRKNLFRVFPMGILCDTYVKGRCVSELNGEALYYDDDHLSNKGAKLVINEVMKFVK